MVYRIQVGLAAEENRNKMYIVSNKLRAKMVILIQIVQKVDFTLHLTLHNFVVIV